MGDELSRGESMAGTSSRNDICATMPSDAERLAVITGIVSGSSSDGPKAGNPKHHGCRLQQRSGLGGCRSLHCCSSGSVGETGQ